MQTSQNQVISQQTKILIDKLLLGKFTLAEVAKITGIPGEGLKSYLNANPTLEPQQVLSQS